LRKSQESIVSEKIVDDYSDDFDQIEESSRLNKKGGVKKEEDSSGGFEEQYEDDMF
jgi:hypothetical protein